MSTLATTKTKDQLLADNNILLNKLREGSRKDYDGIIEQMNANKAAIKELDKIALLNKVNGKYSRLRVMALQAYNCEVPTEDITTNGRDFHKAKVKKYPNIAALQYADGIWEENRLMTIRINGEKFNMYRGKYESMQPVVYTRPETFADFLSLNCIPVEDITLDQYNEYCSKLKALNNKLKEDIKRYETGLESIGNSSFNYYGLSGQHNVHLYEYTPNY